ncbi:hypothetical protein AB0B44_29220, partial [Streptomyces sp. NPDC041003]
MKRPTATATVPAAPSALVAKVNPASAHAPAADRAAAPAQAPAPKPARVREACARSPRSSWSSTPRTRW